MNTGMRRMVYNTRDTIVYAAQEVLQTAATPILSENKRKTL